MRFGIEDESAVYVGWRDAWWRKHRLKNRTDRNTTLGANNIRLRTPSVFLLVRPMTLSPMLAWSKSLHLNLSTNPRGWERIMCFCACRIQQCTEKADMHPSVLFHYYWDEFGFPVNITADKRPAPSCWTREANRRFAIVGVVSALFSITVIALLARLRWRNGDLKRTRRTKLHWRQLWIKKQVPVESSQDPQVLIPDNSPSSQATDRIWRKSVIKNIILRSSLNSKIIQI